METPDFHLQFATWPDHLPELRAVREPVFLVEQQVAPELEWDDLDAQSTHVLARDHNGTPIGTGRLTPQGGIGRMAVLQPWRGRGVGSALLAALIDQARESSFASVELHAQTHAIGFYERFGFKAFGPEYEEAGIPHRSMRLTLAPATDESALREITSASELAQLTLEVISRARREVAIYSRDLDPPLLGSRAALDALRRFAIGTRDAQLRVLVHDLRRAIREGHGLIQLGQRLSSHVSFRVIEQEPDVQYAGASTNTTPLFLSLLTTN